METFTFYSYKGGTGRSLLVANAARYLASLGKRVVAIDFDLEAPGLHYKMYIGGAKGRTGETIPERGVVDYLLAAAEGESSPQPLTRYLTSVALPASTPGKLYLMPAGAAPSGAYWKSLSALTRRDFFSDPNGAGIAACLELKARIEVELEADFILIDSRTGITEIAGLATTLLADKVVCLMINNRESLVGVRAVMRSFGPAPRLNVQGPIELLPVLSRVPEKDDATQQEVLRFLNEPGPSPSETLALKRIFVLRVDPDLAAKERLYIGSGDSNAQSNLHKDYLAFFEAMVTADPKLLSAAARRLEAIAAMKSWLIERSDVHRNRRLTPDGFGEEQIEEGVELGKTGKRYADLVAYGGKDRSEPLLAVEYVEDLKTSKAWQSWEMETSLRCVVLIGKEEGGYFKKRCFTRGKRGQKFIERDDSAGWGIQWPVSFTALDDPGDRSVDSMLRSVQRGEDSFIGLLVREWQHSSFATLHGGFPYRPQLARRILDGLAQVTDPEIEMRVLWRSAPDPFERDHDGMKGGGSPEEMTTRELHAPLWWRFSVQSKIEYSGRRGRMHESQIFAGIELLARDLMGLAIDADRDFRQEAKRLIGPEKTLNDDEVSIYKFAGLLRERELSFELSGDAPPELVRRAALDHLRGDGESRSSDSTWARAEAVSRDALADARLLGRLARNSSQPLQIVITNLLGSYDADKCTITIYSKLIDWASRVLGVEERALANVVFLHMTVYAICHLGRDLDGRMWDNFGLPPARDIGYRSSQFLETLAHYFSYRLIQRLEDTSLMTAFERLSACQPPEFQGWEKLRNVPVEEVRKILIQARDGLGAAFGIAGPHWMP